ncbi:HAD family hydrolase, partial [Vibrio parahaemolyticus]|uniref:HAD family hydrolase n=1 Tax=Vibrio parahaemolyticus TaxID=670 RepID=UPI001A8E3529
PGQEENPITVGIEDGPDAIVAAVLTRLGPPAGGLCKEGGSPMDIALVVSDVDGTLVTDDKRLTPAALAAVRRLGTAGIGFTLAS